MSQIRSAVLNVRQIDELSERKIWVNQMHPFIKLGVTIAYLFTVTSFSRYDLFGVLSMYLYLFVGFLIADLSYRQCVQRIRYVLPLILLLSIANPIFDANRIQIGSIVIPAGFLSMMTLWMKGIACVTSGYLLIATTGIENICYALQVLHVPPIIITQILLTYRYLSLLMVEVHRVSLAYALRAPKQKGIHYTAWGSLAGQLLLRSIDRANEVYESMVLRGYQGSFVYMTNKNRHQPMDWLYLIAWILIFFLFRKVPVLILLGSLVGG